MLKHRHRRHSERDLDPMDANESTSRQPNYDKIKKSVFSMILFSTPSEEPDKQKSIILMKKTLPCVERNLSGFHFLR